MPRPLAELTDLLRARLRSSESRALARGGAGALVLRIAGTACTLLLQVLLARVLGVERFGEYVYVVTWVTVLVMVATLGLDTAALRFIPTYTLAGDHRSVRGFVRWSAAWVLLAALTLGALVCAGVTLAGPRIPASLARTFYAGTLLLPTLALLQLCSSLVRGFKEVVAAMAPQWVVRPLLLAGAVLAWVAARDEVPSAAWTMVLDGLITAVALLAVGLALRRAMARVLTGTEPGTGSPRTESRLWIRTALPLLAVAGLRMLMVRLDILTVGGLRGAADAGVYAVASQMSALVAFGLLAVNMIAAPLFAEMHAAGRREDLQRVVRLGSLAAFSFGLATGLGLLAIAPWLLPIYGPSFTAAYAPLTILVLSQVLGGAAGSVGFLAAMAGQERTAAWIAAGAALANLLLNLVLVPWLGMIGAALATLVAEVGWNGGLILVSRRRLGIRPTAFGV